MRTVIFFSSTGGTVNSKYACRVLALGNLVSSPQAVTMGKWHLNKNIISYTLNSFTLYPIRPCLKRSTIDWDIDKCWLVDMYNIGTKATTDNKRRPIYLYQLQQQHWNRTSPFHIDATYHENSYGCGLNIISEYVCLPDWLRHNSVQGVCEKLATANQRFISATTLGIRFIFHLFHV